jgi:hypothetical protein
MPLPSPGKKRGGVPQSVTIHIEKNRYRGADVFLKRQNFIQPELLSAT